MAPARAAIFIKTAKIANTVKSVKFQQYLSGSLKTGMDFTDKKPDSQSYHKSRYSVTIVSSQKAFVF